MRHAVAVTETVFDTPRTPQWTASGGGVSREPRILPTRLGGSTWDTQFMMQTSAAVFGELEFVLGAARLAQLPEDQGLEVAFGGRSNAGKSTAINSLAGRRALARTSKTPGRTQQINFFRLDDERRIVDLPGYGFARAPIAAQRQWGRLVEGYLQSRECLAGLVLLVDARRPLTALDQQMIAWCDAGQLAVHVVLTKSDKLSQSKAMAALAATERALAALRVPWRVQLFSAPRRRGIDELAMRLQQWLKIEG